MILQTKKLTIANDFVNPIEPLSQIADVEQVTDIKVKRTRKPSIKKNKTIQEDDKPVEEPEIVAIPVDEPSSSNEDKQVKNVKITELTQCEKCGKHLTARTLKYSHANVCPANENKPLKKHKLVEIEEPLTPEKLTHKPERAKRQEQLNKLFASAV